MSKMKFSIAVMLISITFVCTSGSLAGYWETATVDDTDFCWDHDLAIVNGQPSIGYSTQSGNLRHARLNGEAWETSTVPGLSTRSAVSLAEISGQPAMAYGSRGYTRFNGSSWVISGYPGPDGLYPSLVEIDGQPAIAYHGAINDFIYYTKYDGTAWSNTQVDGRASYIPSLALVDGQPAIAYSFKTYLSGSEYTYELKYARYNGSTWDFTAIDITSNPYSVSWPSLAIVSGQPAISYLKHVDTDTCNLMYARYNGSAWTTEVVAEDAYSYRGTSLAEIDGRPAIAYQGSSALLSINYAEFDGTAWNIDMVSSQGANPSLEIIEGRPAISYETINDGFLMYATYIPEPATMVMVILGGLTLLRRRIR